MYASWSQTAPGIHAGIWRHLHPQYSGPSHANPYTNPGSLLFVTHKAFRLSKIPMLHTQILMPVQDPSHSQENPHACPGCQQFKQLLHWGQAPQNSKNSLNLYRFPTIEAAPYACTGSQPFQQLLHPLKADDTSNANPYACTGSQQFEQLLMPVQAPSASNNSLHN
ncbi:hypothetical protein O181_013230 [Austropuccinia psidii MF-1]|uniref:Uncharacterized protein n=1 Tax=Austropuccinia psidii MF-1 TaxID=1389203 RepID=A0A9Q3GNQ3_9BASI|nr:hypothetical protein [Austropuccinia psidii MF-1]